MNSSDEPLVAIVVLNWNGCAETLECLKALDDVDYQPQHLIVVDNGSTDGSVQAFRKFRPDLDLVEIGHNLGYAGGNNRGIERALKLGAEYVLILNNDARLDREALSRAVKVSQSLGHRAGMIGFAVYSYDQPDVLTDLGLELDEQDGGFYLHMPREEELAANEHLPITSAHGCAMLVSRTLLERVGLFDEKFFLMAEECDLAARARRAGFMVVGATHARVWHKGSAAFGGTQSPLRLFYILRNRPLYLKKRFAEGNQPERFGVYLSRFERDTRSLAGQYVRQLKLSTAFAVLAALHLAKAERWGQFQLSVSTRARVMVDLLLLIARGAVRVTATKLSQRRRAV